VRVLSPGIAADTTNLNPVLNAIGRPEIFSPHDTALKKAVSNSAVGSRKSTCDTLPVLDKMVVRGTRIREFTPSKVIVEAKDFSGKYADLQSVLQTVSGVTVCNSSGFGHFADVSIRGSSPSQVQVYLDGIPLNGATGNAVDVSKIPLSSLQNITIYKTTPPLEIFGDNAGGVINLTTDATKDATTASLELGSFGYREGNAMICKTLGQMTHRLSVNYGWSDNDYPYTDSIVTHSPTIATDDPLKKMDNNFFSTVSTLYSNTYAINDGNKLTSQISVLATDEGIFYLPMADSNDGTVEKNTISVLESYTTTIAQSVSLTVAAAGHTSDESFRRFKPYYLTTPNLRNFSEPYGSLEAIAQGGIGNHVILKGILDESYNGFVEDNLLVPAPQPQPNFFRLTSKAGMEAKAYFCKEISARFGGLYRYEIDSANDSVTSSGIFVPGGGLTKKGFPGGFAEARYQPFDCLGFEASIQYESRSPGFSEKYAEGARVTGNSSLRPETRLEYDLGFSFLKSWIALSGDLFASTTKDKIVYIGHSTMFTPTNVSDVYAWGLECNASINPFAWVSLTNSLTYMENVIHSDLYSSWNGHDEPLQPRCTDNLNVSFTYKNWYASHSARFISRYFTNFDNLDSVQQSKPQLNASIGCAMGKHFDLSYRIENYLNVQNYDFQRPLPGLTQYVVLKSWW
jgi:outer membrane cobalamin receptor